MLAPLFIHSHRLLSRHLRRPMLLCRLRRISPACHLHALVAVHSQRLPCAACRAHGARAHFPCMPSCRAPCAGDCSIEPSVVPPFVTTLDVIGRLMRISLHATSMLWWRCTRTSCLTQRVAHMGLGRISPACHLAVPHALVTVQSSRLLSRRLRQPLMV